MQANDEFYFRDYGFSEKKKAWMIEGDDSCVLRFRGDDDKATVDKIIVLDKENAKILMMQLRQWISPFQQLRQRLNNIEVT